MKEPDPERCMRRAIAVRRVLRHAHARMSTMCYGVIIWSVADRRLHASLQFPILHPANPTKSPGRFGDSSSISIMHDVMSRHKLACSRRWVESPLMTGGLQSYSPKEACRWGCPTKITSPVISKRMLAGVT